MQQMSDSLKNKNSSFSLFQTLLQEGERASQTPHEPTELVSEESLHHGWPENQGKINTKKR